MFSRLNTEVFLSVFCEVFSNLNTEVLVMSPNRKARLRDSYQLQKFLSDARELVR